MVYENNKLIKQFRILSGLFLIAILAVQPSCIMQKIAKSKVESNHRLWHESKITDYKMTIKVFQSGHANPSGTRIVEVRGGTATSIKIAESGLIDDSVKWKNFDTVEKIFGIIEVAIGKNPATLDVEYDEKLGYPEKLRLEYSFSMTDDELAVDILHIERL